MEQELHVLLLLLALFSPVELTDDDLRVESRNGGLVTLPSEDGLTNNVTLTCLLYNAPRLGNGLHTEWAVENKVHDQSISTPVSNDKYEAGLHSFREPQQMYLTIKSLSYKHSGSYRCLARDVGSDSYANWVSANIDLSLNLRLEASPMTITVDNETGTVELSCEMSQYIQPDSNLQWYRHGNRIAASEKYNISYENGTKKGQMGGSKQQSSRVSTLVISDFQEEDKGFYHCNITGTENSETIYISLGEPDPRLNVESSGDSLTPLDEDLSNSTDTPTVESPGDSFTPSDEDTPTDASDDPEGEKTGGNDGEIGGVPVLTLAVAGGSVGLVAVFLVVLLLMLCCACFWKARSKKVTNNTSEGESSVSRLWPSLPPPLPLRTNHRSLDLDYYVNEGMDPEKPYIPVSVNAGYPARTSWLDDDDVSIHEYEPIPNEYDHLPHESAIDLAEQSVDDSLPVLPVPEADNSASNAENSLVEDKQPI